MCIYRAVLEEGSSWKAGLPQSRTSRAAAVVLRLHQTSVSWTSGAGTREKVCVCMQGEQEAGCGGVRAQKWGVEIVGNECFPAPSSVFDVRVLRAVFAHIRRKKLVASVSSLYSKLVWSTGQSSLQYLLFVVWLHSSPVSSLLLSLFPLLSFYLYLTSECLLFLPQSTFSLSVHCFSLQTPEHLWSLFLHC